MPKPFRRLTIPKELVPTVLPRPPRAAYKQRKARISLGLGKAEFAALDHWAKQLALTDDNPPKSRADLIRRMIREWSPCINSEEV